MPRWASSAWRSVGWRGRARLSRQPSLFLPLYRHYGRKPELAFNHATQLVIEGYPRSANTYAVVAFAAVQPERPRIAHHLHVAAQVLAAVDRDIPTMVLIRRPLDAVSSLLIRESGFEPGRAIGAYRNFYEPLLPKVGRFVLAPFEDVTTDYGSVIDRLNERFQTEYVRYDHAEDLEQQIMDRIDVIDRKRVDGPVDEDRVARPSEQRVATAARLKEQLRERRDMQELEVLYERVMDTIRP